MSEHMPVAPRSREEGTNGFSSSDVFPVEAFSFAVSPVGAYFMVKEIIWKKSEKKKRREEEQKRAEDVPVVPPSRVALPQVLVTSIIFLCLDLFSLL